MLILWDKKSNIIQPNGVEYTPEQIFGDPNFGFSKYAETVLTKLGQITVGIDNLDILLQVYNLDPNLKGKKALDAIIAAKEAQTVAAQNAAAMPDPQMVALEKISAIAEEMKTISQQFVEMAQPLARANAAQMADSLTEAVKAANSVKIDETATRTAIINRLGE